MAKTKFVMLLTTAWRMRAPPCGVLHTSAFDRDCRSFGHFAEPILVSRVSSQTTQNLVPRPHFSQKLSDRPLFVSAVPVNSAWTRKSYGVWDNVVWGRNHICFLAWPANAQSRISTSESESYRIKYCQIKERQFSRVSGD